ncbi:Cell division topological specificity factor [Halomonadaceae bacterium LMG 33818]|uniref:cell division topological specificity factor MinE n=1 Tax=Cernens ardua TaxID=3402176 RepID=UPI003EDBC6D6
MRLLDFFRGENKKTASVAKERLQIIVAHQRGQRGQPDYMPMLERELLEVIRRYVEVDRDAISINLDRDADCSVLELNVTLPNQED